MSNYPHIDNYYKNLSDLLGHKVDVLEKIDGSNFSIYVRPDGFISYKSKGQEICNNTVNNGGTWWYKSDAGMFRDAIILADKIAPHILEIAKQDKKAHWWFFEFFGKGIQGRIDYDRYLKTVFPSFVSNSKSLILIDIATQSPKRPNDYTEFINITWLKWTEVRDYCAILSQNILIPMPEWQIISELKLSHIQGIQKGEGAWNWLGKFEGVVIRDAQRSKNNYDELLQTKVKTEWYEAYEKRGGEKNLKIKEAVSPEILDFAHSVINFGRLNSIYSHGYTNLKKEMRDMQHLPQLIFEDVRAENAPIWSKFEEDKIRHSMNKLMPVILKKWLLEQQVTNGTT